MTPYAIVDVFTNRRWAGNPLAVILDASRLSPAQMLSIARETNLSETTFITRRSADIEHRQGVAVRIFSPHEELPFAGHPTLGTAWMLHQEMHQSEILLDLKAGPIPVTFRDAPGGSFGEMTQPTPTFGRTHSSEVIAKLIGLAPSEILTDLPLETVSTGRPKIMVPLASLAVIRKIKPDFAAIEAYCRSTGGATGLYYVTLETEDPKSRVHARNLLSWTEDPVTGSAGGACIAWLVKHGRARSGEPVVIEQGSEAGRPGSMTGSAILKDGVVSEVRLGGQCALTARGEFYYP